MYNMNNNVKELVSIALQSSAELKELSKEDRAIVAEMRQECRGLSPVEKALATLESEAEKNVYALVAIRDAGFNPICTMKAVDTMLKYTKGMGVAEAEKVVKSNVNILVQVLTGNNG